MFIMDTKSLEDHLPLLKTLADETRLRLIGHVAKGEQRVVDLAKSLNLTEPTISHHLAKLSAVGLLTLRVDGNSRYYMLDPQALRAVGRVLAAQSRSPAVAIKPEAEAGDEEERRQRVLRSFIVDGRLTKIPEGHGKRMVVLRWLVEHFQSGRIYKEREVNAIIKQFHPDFATIRREFIGHGLMEREDGKYWKTQETK